MIGQNFLWVFGQSKLFSGAFGASQFRPKKFFGAFSASNNSGSPEEGGGGSPHSPTHSPPTAPPTHPPQPHPPTPHSPTLGPPPPSAKLWGSVSGRAPARRAREGLGMVRWHSTSSPPAPPPPRQTRGTGPPFLSVSCPRWGKGPGDDQDAGVGRGAPNGGPFPATAPFWYVGDTLWGGGGLVGPGRASGAVVCGGQVFVFFFSVKKRRPPTAVGCPPTAVGCPPTAVGRPSRAVQLCA